MYWSFCGSEITHYPGGILVRGGTRHLYIKYYKVEICGVDRQSTLRGSMINTCRSLILGGCGSTWSWSWGVRIDMEKQTDGSVSTPFNIWLDPLLQLLMEKWQFDNVDFLPFSGTEEARSTGRSAGMWVFLQDRQTAEWRHQGTGKCNSLLVFRYIRKTYTW